MANKIIKLNSDASIHYFPTGTGVQTGDTVTFKLACTTCTATVTFDSAGCLDGTNPFYLDGSSPATAELTRTVIATSGNFPFTADVEGGTEKHSLGGQVEAKRGELDVNTEPPPPEESARS